MPSDISTWLIAIPQSGDSVGIDQELQSKLDQAKALPRSNVAELLIPSLKTGTLDLLVTLSEELPKQDTFFTNAVAKIVDTLRNLLNNDPKRLAQHTLVNERTCDEYLLDHWRWNAGKYGSQRSLRDVVDSLVKEMTSIDNVMKNKLNSYNLAKGSLVQMQRKKTGNLSVKSLVDVVSKEHVISESEYLETVFVAVPRSMVKEWNASYERLTPMIVPRSSTKIAEDSEFTLFGAVLFKKVRDDFAQKCRENKFILRDFTYDEKSLGKQREELETADVVEKELWTELLRLSSINFSEAYQVLVHLKVVRLFVESVLRYGLPANYTGLVVKPETKTTKKTLSILTTHLAHLTPRSKKSGAGGGSGARAEDIMGEYQAIMDQEYLDFVFFEVPWIVS